MTAVRQVAAAVVIIYLIIICRRDGSNSKQKSAKNHEQDKKSESSLAHPSDDDVMKVISNVLSWWLATVLQALLSATASILHPICRATRFGLDDKVSVNGSIIM